MSDQGSWTDTYDNARAELALRLFAMLSDRQLSLTLDFLTKAQQRAAGMRRRGHPSPNAKWSSAEECLHDLCEWAAELPEDALPPLEADAARHFGVSRRTLARWISKNKPVSTWEDFCRYYWVAQREVFGTNGQLTDPH